MPVKYKCSICRDHRHVEKDNKFVPCVCYWNEEKEELDKWFEVPTHLKTKDNIIQSRLLNKDLRVYRDSKLAYDLCFHYIKSGKSLLKVASYDIKQSFEDGEYFKPYLNHHVLLVDIEQYSKERFDRVIPRLLMDLANRRKRLNGVTLWMYGKPFENQIHSSYTAYEVAYDKDSKDFEHHNVWKGFVDYLGKLEQI